VIVRTQTNKLSFLILRFNIATKHVNSSHLPPTHFSSPSAEGRCCGHDLGHLWPCALSTAAMASQVVGEVTLTIGKSKIERSTQEAEPQKGGSVQEGDVIRTSDNGHVHIRFIDGARISVRPNSVFRIHEFKYSPSDPAASVVRLSLDSGEARSISGAAAQAAKERFRLNTPLVAIGVKGTDFVTQVSKETIRVTVNQGAIVMAPFDSGCKAEALGVCTTSRAKELTAEMLGQALVYRLGTADPSLQNIGKPGQSDAARILLDRPREGTDRPLASETEAKNPLNVLAATKLIWGRWAKDPIPSDSITVPFLEALKGNEVTVGDGYYFLFREPSNLNVLPSLSTKVDFGLKSSSAYFRNAANEIQPASVQSGTFGVDFGNKTFSTHLNLSAQGTGVQSFSQSGTLNPSTGIFLSNSTATATGGSTGSVAGALTLDARQAGFLFRAPVTTSIGAGAFSGATLWGR
jgi:hypothetical protein